MTTFLMSRFTFVLLCLVLIAHPAQAQANLKQDALAQINRARLTNGQAPLAYSPILEKAAQRHSDDMARNSFISDAGSDDSTAKDRMVNAGYLSWSNDRLIWGENLYADVSDFSAALNFILNDASQARILMNPRYREIGIGIGTADGGKLYWTLLYGAQPNVLPVFINDGNPVTNNATVAVRLSQEEAVINGEPNVIGRVIDVRLSSNANFLGASWQPWQPLLEFKFDTKPGVKTVYAQYRDGAGRTASAAASINYDPNASNSIESLGPGDIRANETPTVIITLTPEPTLTQSPAPTQSPQPIVEGTSTAVVIGDSGVVVAPATPMTQAPSPVPQATPTTPNLQTIPTSFIVDLDATQAAQTVEPTPANRASSIIEVVATETPIAPAPRASLSRFNLPLPNWLLPGYLIAQALVILMGLYAFFKRR
jgi:hypothetical protein